MIVYQDSFLIIEMDILADLIRRCREIIVYE